MTIRMTRTGIYQYTQSMLARTTNDMMSLQEQISSLKRINKPSDDPSGAARALGLHTTLDTYRRYLGNMERAQGGIDHTTIVLQSISGYIVRVRALIMQASNPGLPPHVRAAIAGEVDGILGSVVDDANAAHEGRYIFAGTLCRIKPFAPNIAAGPGGSVTSVSYEGNIGAIGTTVGPDSRVKVNENGQEVFMRQGPGEDLFSVIAQSRDLIENTELSSTERAEQLSGMLATIDSVHNDMLESMGRVAGRAKSLELRRNLYEDAEIGTTRALAEVEDADISQLIYDLQREKTQFEMILAASASILQPTLMEFLR